MRRAMPTPPTPSVGERRPLPTPQTLSRAPAMRKAKALYSFQGTEPTDLSFEADDIILLHDTSLSWYKGELERQRGAIGHFPSNYVEMLDN